MSDEREDTDIYGAVVNDEEQYSIWPVGRELPLGWREAGKEGPRAEVLAWIEEMWTGMRPRNLRQQIALDAPDESEGHPSRVVGYLLSACRRAIAAWLTVCSRTKGACLVPPCLRRRCENGAPRRGAPILFPD